MNIVTGLEEKNVLHRVPWQELSSTDDVADKYHRPFLLHTTTRDWINAIFLKSADQRQKWALLACSYCVHIIKKLEQKSLQSEINFLGHLMLPHAEKCYELNTLLDNDTRNQIEWHVLGNLCMTQGSVLNYSSQVRLIQVSIILIQV